MQRRAFLLGVAAAALGSACGGTPPTGPTPIVDPPVQPPQPNPGPDPAPVVVPVLSVTRLLCFGDSMTEGTTSPPLSVLTSGIPQSYPFKLQDLETARYKNQTIVILNAGLAGQRVDDPQTQPRMDQAIKEGRPEVLLLMDGANDMLALSGTTTGLNDGISKAVNAMEDLVRDAAGRGIKVVVMTLPPQRASGSRGGAAPFLSRYNDQLKAMAARKGAQVVDVNALFPLSLVGQDGLHLTEAGNQKLAEIMRDEVARMFDVKT